MCILLSPQTTTLTGSSGSMCILLSRIQHDSMVVCYIVVSQTTTLTGSSGSICIL